MEAHFCQKINEIIGERTLSFHNLDLSCNNFDVVQVITG